MITNPWWLLLIGTAVVVAIMFALWRHGIRNHNFSYVDIGWSVNFAVLAGIYAWLAPGYPAAPAAHRRDVHGAWTAPRLASVQAHHRRAGRRSLSAAAQGLGRWRRALAEPEIPGLLRVPGRAQRLPDAAAAHRLLQRLRPAFICWRSPAPRCFSSRIVGESVADAQLAAFKHKPGEQGWRVRRRAVALLPPSNYFFEWLIWIAYALFALASPWGWIALAMPALMLHFLINVTGLKATEEQALRSKGERYRLYQARTSAFVPWFPKRIEQ